METESNLRQRERRFEVADLAGFDAIVTRADAEDSQFFAELIDFSRMGVKFSLPFFAKFDEVLDIQFKLKNSDLHYVGQGRVRHIRNIEENRWHVGCSLDPPLPDEVVGFLAKSTDQERRRFQRMDVGQHQGCLRRQGRLEGCEATLLNFSEGGLCLRVAQEHRTGERVDFVIENKAGHEETIAARIRWQSEVEDGFRLGCSFADTLSYQKLAECVAEKKAVAGGESIKWYVAFAAILVMFIPPLSYVLIGFNAPVARQETVAAASDDKISNPHPSNDSPDTPNSSKGKNPGDVDQDNIQKWPGKKESEINGLFVDTGKPDDTIVMHSPIGNTAAILNEPSSDDKLPQKEILANPIQLSNKKTQGKADTVRKESTPAMATGDNSTRLDHPIVSKTDSKSNNTPRPKNMKAVSEPSPPQELLADKNKPIRAVRSTSASTRRTKATRPLIVPSEIIVE